MRTKNLMIAFTILCVILLASRETLAVTVGSWVDTNKKFYQTADQDNDGYEDGWILNYNDTSGDGYHDGGEMWSIWSDSYYSSRADDASCWMASASNMLQYELPSLYDAETTYNYLLGGVEGVVPAPQTDPWGDTTYPDHGTHSALSFTFDDGGFQEWVFSTYSVAFAPPIHANAGKNGVWATNPIVWCVEKITEDHPVGLGIYWEGSGGHAITLWGIDPDAKELSITDLDDSKTANYLIGYEYTGNQQWKLYDKYNIWDNQTAYASYAVAIPEPATLILLGVGSLMVFRRRRR